MYKLFRVAILSIALSSLVGCVAAATTAAGIGGSAAVNHTITGVAYRTFTAPVSKVKRATFTALKRMKIKVVSKGMNTNDDVYVIAAETSKRKIEVEIEQISSNATKISVKAKKSIFVYDSATADEIVMQTKRLLG